MYAEKKVRSRLIANINKKEPVAIVHDQDGRTQAHIESQQSVESFVSMLEVNSKNEKSSKNRSQNKDMRKVCRLCQDNEFCLEMYTDEKRGARVRR